MNVIENTTKKYMDANIIDRMYNSTPIIMVEITINSLNILSE